jgi:pantoate--beta-alanine ligase
MPVEIAENINELREKVRVLQDQKVITGFVPTMGFLHRGHLSLLEKARLETDYVILSIFVNPLQFGRGEDLDNYPRDLPGDLRQARAAGCGLVYLPREEELYPPGYNTYVTVEGLTEGLCGASRPGHFRGVATIVAKLFNLVQPAKAYFGQKDYQQAQVIKKMVADLNMDLEVVICPTVRESDGLAMSSRNSYLSPPERAAAVVLYRALREGEAAIALGERDGAAVEERMRQVINAEPLASIDYLAVVDGEILRPLKLLRNTVVLAGAIKIGRTRLIDNIIVKI